MKVQRWMTGAALTLAACSSSPKPKPPSAAPHVPAAPLPPPPAAPAVQPPAPPQSPIPKPAPVVDQCGAAALQDLVGKPRTEIPVPVDPSRRRVYCTTCIVTQDYDPGRLDIVFDAQTGRVTQVKCG